MVRSLPIGLGVIALALVACGGNDEPARDGASGGRVPAQQSDTADPPSTTSSGQRGAIERRLVRYFKRNFQAVGWYGDVRRFEVRGGEPVRGFEEIENATVVVHTGLDAQDRTAARQICAGVFGADAADVGGTVQVLAEGGEMVAECPSDL